MKLALVEWADAYTTHGWRDDEEIEGLRTAYTVSCGILKLETKDSISLILNQGRGIYADGITIPKGCIKRIRYLKVNSTLR